MAAESAVRAPILFCYKLGRVMILLEVRQGNELKTVFLCLSRTSGNMNIN
jgi:hypothetical protein